MEKTRKPPESGDQALRKQLISLLTEPQAHMMFADAVKNFPVEKAGIRPAGSPHSAWELLEHIRIAQDDIIRFSGAFDDASRPKDSRESPKDYVALKWPDDYWPQSPAPRDSAEWNESIAAVEEDLATFVKLLSDNNRNLTEPFPWGTGQTLLREALLIADHNAYHVGQIVLLQKMLA